MSSLYPDLVNKFDGVTLDDVRLFKDVDIENKPYVDLFYTYYNQGNYSAIQQLFIDRPDLKNMLITAEAIQYIYDMSISLQRFYTEDFRKFLIDSSNYPVNISDNLTTDSDIMSLSARQGMILKSLIDSLNNAKAPNNHASTDTTYGIGSGVNYGHVRTSVSAPLVNGTASAGTPNGIVANADHIHPSQVNISGNATTATRLQTPRTIAGKPFDGTQNVTLTAYDVGAIPTNATCNKNWNWSGQSGQPIWLWGTNDDPSNVFLYNPSNFNVNYANNCANAANASVANTAHLGITYNYTTRYLRCVVMIPDGASWPTTLAGDTIHVYK